MKKIIIAGSRYLNNYVYVENILNRIFSNINLKEIEIVSGGAKGADFLGETYAKNYNIKLKKFPADWNNLGKKAGPIRNQKMAKYATHCIIFWDENSKGSKNMLNNAELENLKILSINFEKNTIKKI